QQRIAMSRRCGRRCGRYIGTGITQRTGTGSRAAGERNLSRMRNCFSCRGLRSLAWANSDGHNEAAEPTIRQSSDLMSTAASQSAAAVIRKPAAGKVAQLVGEVVYLYAFDV